MNGCVCAAISAPVRAQITPARASAEETSTLTIFACAYGERTNFRYSISRSLMSSANLPRPRSNRFSSLRGSACPTQVFAPFLLIALTPVSSPQRRLQAINQLLNLFLPQRLQQAASHGRKAPEDLRLTLPRHFCAGGV